MTRWTKKRIAEQLEWSNVCYREAVLIHFGHLLANKEKDLPMWELKGLIKVKLQVETFNFPELNTTYLEKLRQLETKKLELIIEAYHKGKQWRSASTIDVLLSELFERATNPKRRNRVIR